LSGTGGIPISFFRELGIALRHEGPDNDVEKRSKKLQTYAASLSLLGSTAAWAGKAAQFCGMPGAPLIETAGKNIKVIAGVTKEGSEALRLESDLAKGLEDQKRELSEMLSRLPQPPLQYSTTPF
jgi:hypothetical protein